MFRSRTGFSRVLLLALLLGSVTVGGVTLAQANPSKKSDTQAETPTPRRSLTDTEQKALADLFTKTRPAALRIEECDTKNCGEEPDGVGSAVLISADGLALTAYHVIFGAKNLSAVTVDKKRYGLSVIGYDDQQDIALLRVNVPRGTPYLPLAQVKPKVGDPLLAIGNGDGLFLKSKTGRLLSLNADATRADFPAGTLEMTAPLIPGDSGGPILNTAGEVVGIVSYIRQSSRTSIRSYAVPVAKQDAKVADLMKGVKRDAPIIGIGLDQRFFDLVDLPEKYFVDATRELNLSLGKTAGAFFTSVARGSPAEKAGLIALDPKSGKGDLVIAVDGKRVVNFSEFQYAVRTYAPGNTITLSVVRGGKPISVKLTLVGRSTVEN